MISIRNSDQDFEKQLALTGQILAGILRWNGKYFTEPYHFHPSLWQGL